MKKGLLFALVALFFQPVSAQDLIIKINGDEVSAHVLEIGVQDILYKLPDPLETDTLHMPKQEVFMIRFANGSREVFTESLPENQQPAAVVLSPEQLYQQGQQDAKINYKPRGAFWGSAALGFVALPTSGISLIGPVVIGAIPPKTQNFVVPDQSLLADPNYVTGYKKQAHRRKAGRSAGGAVVGALTGVATVVIVVIIAFSNWN